MMDGSWDAWDFGKGKGWGPGGGGGGWFGFCGGKGGMKGDMFGGDDFKGCKGGMFGDDFKGCKGGKSKGPSESTRKGSGKGKKAAARIAAGEPFYHGQVRMFNLEKKHGKVACESVHGICGQDVYAYQDVLERAKGGAAGPGDTVAFFLHWSTRGQPQASSPLLRLSGPNAACVLRGTVKSGGPAADRGFAFVECEETKEFFGRDVYLSAELAAGLSPGQTVAFSAFLNRDGMPNVAALEPVDESWQPPPSDLSRSWEVEVEEGVGQAVGKGKDKGKGKQVPWGGDMGGWGGGWGGEKGGWGGEKGGWGGWGCGGGDWWGCGCGCPPQALMALAGMDGAKGSKGGFKGDGCFKGGCDFKGDGCFKGGCDFKGLGKGKGWGGGCGGGCGAQGPSKPVPTGRTYVGVIKSFNEATNYGFIACDEVKAEFGNDVFCHGKTLLGHSVGDVVQFEVGLSGRGQPQALNVQPASEAIGDAAGEGDEEASLEPPAKRQCLGGMGPRGELEPMDGGADGPAMPGWVQQGAW